jgi:hypothetical protein
MGVFAISRSALAASPLTTPALALSASGTAETAEAA